MTEMTALDHAHAAMEGAPGDDAARLRFFERVADSEFFILLEAEAAENQVQPQVYDVEGGKVVLLFDREERLADFVGQTAPYAALSGRALVRILAGQGTGLGLNLGVAPSSILIPASAVDWLAQTLAAAPVAQNARPEEVLPPGDLTETLAVALDAKLALAAGLAQCAYLVGVIYDGGRRGHMLGVVDALPGSEDALAQAISETLTFSAIEDGALDVAFFRASDPICARLARVGLRFDLPEPSKPEGPSAPGTDPENPPILR